MIISDSNVSMSSQRAYSRKTQYQRTTFMWSGDNRQKVMSSQASVSSFSSSEAYGFNYFPSYNRFGKMTDDASGFQSVLQSGMDNIENGSLGTVAPGNISAENLRGNYETMSMTFLRLLDIIKNSRFKMNAFDSSYLRDFGALSRNTGIFSVTSSPAPAIWNRVTQESYSFEERETTSFSSTGTVVTADGRHISFDVTMQMSRKFKQELNLEKFDQVVQVLTDPLVINLDSSPTSITDKTFFFDLDCDGKKEEIAELAKGSGYLALDRNNDGIINDGSELFGTSTGNGFAELAKYDSDGNGWIDEADEIFDKLKVWTKDEHGNSVLLSLKDADVGAICLSNSKTDFSLKDKNSGSLRGMVRQTGIYLKESGGTGTVQQVDF